MSSSDLELARALSRLLSEPPSSARPASPTPPLVSAEPAGPSRFLRFRETAAPVPESAPDTTETGDPGSGPLFPED